MSRAPTDAVAPPLPFSLAEGGVLVRVRVTPRARRPGVDGLAEGPAGQPLLKVCVTAAPADGEANAAVVALLAREWRLPKSTLSVVSGAASRIKTIGIAGDGRALMTSLGAWLQAHGGSTGGRG